MPSIKLLFILAASCIALTEGARKGLVLGGTGFIGAPTVLQLLEKGDSITLVTRDSWPVDTYDTIKPKVDYYYCDRRKRLENCPKLQQALENTYFDYVLDFSFKGYEDSNMEQYLEALKHKVGLYIFISADSVYDVCGNRYGENTRKESDTKRPVNATVRETLQVYFSMGHRKLQAEEQVSKQRHNGGFPYVILRLPDVIGANDSSWRWQTYQLWMQVATVLKNRPVTIPLHVQKYRMSFVYVKDVVRVILQLLDQSPNIIDETFNLAWPNSHLIGNLLAEMAKAARIADFRLKVEEDHKKHVDYYYPTARSGPLNVRKAEEQLGWQPTPFSEAVGETVRYYDELMGGKHDKSYRDAVIGIVASMLFEENEKMKFYEALEKAYNIDLSHIKYPHDEL